MANVFEQGKRGGDLPRLKGGCVHTGLRYRESTPEEKKTGRRPELMYFVEIGKTHPATTGSGFRTEAFSAHFTEDEMIAITSE